VQYNDAYISVESVSEWDPKDQVAHDYCYGKYDKGCHLGILDSWIASIETIMYDIDQVSQSRLYKHILHDI
jgi:hypothetical protein